MLCQHKNAFSSTKTCIWALWSAVELVLKTWVAVSAPRGHKKCHTEKAFSCHVISLYSPVLKDVLRYRDVCLSPCLSKWDKIPGHFQIHIGLPIAAHTHFLLVYVVAVQSKHAIFIDFRQLLSGNTPVRPLVMCSSLLWLWSFTGTGSAEDDQRAGNLVSFWASQCTSWRHSLFFDPSQLTYHNSIGL